MAFPLSVADYADVSPASHVILPAGNYEITGALLVLAAVVAPAGNVINFKFSSVATPLIFSLSFTVQVNNQIINNVYPFIYSDGLMMPRGQTMTISTLGSTAGSGILYQFAAYGKVLL